MNSVDIVTIQEVEHQNLKIVECFLRGFIVKTNDEEYRYARKEQALFKTDEQEFYATNTGIYQKFYLSKDDLNNFRWTFISHLGYAEEIAKKMTEEDKFLNISNLAFDDIVKQKRFKNT